MDFKNEFLKNNPAEFIDEFKEKLAITNLERVQISSFYLILVSLSLYIIAILDQDLLIIKRLNLTFFLMSVLIYVVFNFILSNIDDSTWKRNLFIYLLIFIVLGWSTALISIVPDRYELFSTYSTVILTISAVVYLKWYQSLLIYFSSLLVISINFLSEVEQHVLPKISALFFLILIAWVISRILYNNFMNNFISQKKLEQQKEHMKEQVLKKSKQLKNYENKINQEIIFSVIKLLEIHDTYTSGHSENVASLSESIAISMDLSTRKVKAAYWAGMVHDIGKLLIPLEILNKNTGLSDKEYMLVKKHPVWGYQALKQSKSLTTVAEYVHYHHERWDGRGYPEGLNGDDIPLVSQILTVTDAWDAMTSRRAYREPLSRKQALTEIEKNKGTQFSPEVVEVFLKEEIPD